MMLLNHLFYDALVMHYKTISKCVIAAAVGLHVL